MYIIMYKYSALKINRKSFPNNIKNPIAPAQRKQSPPSPSSPTRPGISNNKPHAATKTTWGHCSIESEGGQARLPYMLLICFTLVARASVGQSYALPCYIAAPAWFEPHVVFEIWLVCIIDLQLPAVKDEVTAAYVRSELIEYNCIILVNLNSATL